MDGRTIDKGHYYGPYQVNLGFKIGRTLEVIMNKKSYQNQTSHYIAGFNGSSLSKKKESKIRKIIKEDLEL